MHLIPLFAYALHPTDLCICLVNIPMIDADDFLSDALPQLSCASISEVLQAEADLEILTFQQDCSLVLELPQTYDTAMLSSW